LVGDEKLRKLPEEWEVVRLGEIVNIYDKQRIPLDSEFRLTIKGNIPYCGATGVIDYINDYIFDGEYLLIAEDGGNFGRFEKTAYMMKGKFWANNHVHILRGRDDISDNNFLMYFMNFQDISCYISGSTREKLNQELLKSIIITLPPLPEQRKIAEILETADKAIEKTDAIIEKYRRIKQGLMQDLLTKGIDEKGQIRSEETHKFKDSPLGRLPEEWEVVRLGEIATVKKDKKMPSRKLPYIGLENIESNTGKLLDIIDASTIKGIASVFNSGDVLFGKLRPNLKKFHYAKMEGFCSTEILVIMPIKSSLMDTIFLYLIIQSPAFLNLAEAKVYGTKMPRTSWDILERFIFPLPPLPEQHRIASVLSQIDEVIEKEERYKEKLERIKQGLMQDLLTGEVRVNHLIKET